MPDEFLLIPICFLLAIAFLLEKGITKRKTENRVQCFGPKDFGPHGGWEGRGVLATFDDLHGLDILVSDDGPTHTEENFRKEWDTDADEVIFRRGKQIQLYWRKDAVRMPEEK